MSIFGLRTMDKCNFLYLVFVFFAIIKCAKFLIQTFKYGFG